MLDWLKRMETSPIPVVTVQTAPFEDQRPGTNGLRRKTAVFEGKKNYLQNYIQSVLSSIDLRDRQGCTMVVGSDGRYFSRAAIEVIVQMAAANGVRIGRPPVSCICSSLSACRSHCHCSALRWCKLLQAGLNAFRKNTSCWNGRPAE